MEHKYSGILLSHKDKIMPFAAIWMDQETVILNEVRQRQITYVEPKKKKKEVQRNVPTEQKELHM